MPVPDSPQAKKWPVSKRYEAALSKILDEGWTSADARRWFGCDHKTLAQRLRKERITRGMAPTATEEKRRRAEQAERFIPSMVRPGANLGLAPLVGERPRLPTDIEEFHETYFGHFLCPDCGERHQSPGFHAEMRAMSQDPGLTRGLINLPPYHAKTTVMLRDTIYDIAHNRNHRTMHISESKPFAELIVGAIKELLTNHDLYANAERNLIEDAGDFYRQGATWRNEAIVVVGRDSSEKDPTVQALGYRGQIYGRRADKIKMDDLASFQNQANPEMVKNMLDWIDGQVLSRIGKNARCLFVGTRVRPGDIYETLGKRAGYRVVRYSAIADEHKETMLWPEHFDYLAAEIRREEMDPAMWQLVYQNVETLTHGVSFRAEDIDATISPGRGIGHYEGHWFLIAGLDPAGSGPESGYTAFVLMGLDAHTGQRFIIDAEAHKQMRAPQMKAKIEEWSEKYPIYEWRVENNGIQRNLLQYNEDIIRPLAARGIRMTGHNTTGHNKWDPQFGVESMAVLFPSLISIPRHPEGSGTYELIRQLKNFPLMPVQDLVMAMWFAEIGCRDIVNRPALPMFDRRTSRWPKRIREGRHLVDFGSGTAEKIPLAQQDGRLFSREAMRGRRRQVVGSPTMHPNLVDSPGSPDLQPFMNREGYVDVSGDQ